LSVSVNAATNRLTASGVTYDNNGNVTAGFAGLNLYYDTVNRLSEVQTTGGSSYYGYDPANQRVYYRNAAGAETIYFYGADGKKLATYTYTIITYDGNPEIQLTQQSENVYFTGILISATTDRLGSVIANSSGSHHYYPYGVEYTASTNDTEKYATYTRDSLTGLDYAMNRYYSNQWGRFLSPDPYKANTGGPGDSANPQSWNRYSYAANDPVNGLDPTGQLFVLTYSGWCEAPDEELYICDEYGFGGLYGPDPGPATGSGGGGIIAQAVADAVKALHDKNCGAVFNTNPNLSQVYDPGQVLDSIMNGIKLGDQYFGTWWAQNLGPGIAAVTEEGNGEWVGGTYEYTSANIILQDNGPAAYFDQSPAALALTLIHELGHVFNMVAGLGGSAIQYDANPDGTPNQPAEAANAKALLPCAKALGLN
jgi:RHS repeat-associated protein